MNQPLPEAWAAIARLQGSRATSTNEATIQALDLMIDRCIDRIAANHTAFDDPAEARRATATATRRERHRARLVRLHLVAPASDDQNRVFASTETAFAARQVLSTIFGQTSPQDAALLLSVGQGDVAQAPGLTATTARKRLCRLRARFAHLNLYAA